MFTVQRRSFSATAHVEFPWLESNNAWQQAFDWVRLNTPKNAVFALEPNHMDHPGEDRRGFRAYAERSSLADSNKDGGVAALFPNISDTWLEQTNAAAMLQDPQRAQDAPSLVKTGATWMVTSRPYTNSLDCPYRNAVVEVCRIRYLTYRVKAEPSALAGENLLDRKSHSTDMTAQRNRSNY
jgi:hypothetical protein